MGVVATAASTDSDTGRRGASGSGRMPLQPGGVDRTLSGCQAKADDLFERWVLQQQQGPAHALLRFFARPDRPPSGWAAGESAGSEWLVETTMVDLPGQFALQVNALIEATSPFRPFCFEDSPQTSSSTMFQVVNLIGRRRGEAFEEFARLFPAPHRTHLVI